MIWIIAYILILLWLLALGLHWLTQAVQQIRREIDRARERRKWKNLNSNGRKYT